MKTKKFPSGFGGLFIAVFVLALLFIYPSIQKALTYKNVPEMSDILAEDQDTRLKAVRILVERVGVEDALEILEYSPLPHTGEGHLAVHQVGFYAYQKYGKDSILHCKDYFLYACYHGAIIEAATNGGFGAVSQMTDTCKDSASRYFQCAHAAGHAILAIWGYQNLPDALKTCDDIFEKEKAFPSALGSCHNGAFMENIFGVHDWGTGRSEEKPWLSENPYFPCNSVGNKYQQGCWLNQAARIFELTGGDIAKTSDLCQKTGNTQYTMWCMDNLARQIHPQTNGDIDKVFTLCPLVGDTWREHCITTNASSYYSVGGKEESLAICQKVISQTKESCYRGILWQIISDNVSYGEKQDLCTKLETPYKEECLSQIKADD